MAGTVSPTPAATLSRTRPIATPPARAEPTSPGWPAPTARATRANTPTETTSTSENRAHTMNIEPPTAASASAPSPLTR